MEFIELGKITKPQGIKGEIRVATSFNKEQLSGVGKVFIDGVGFSVSGIKFTADFAIVKLDGVNDRNHAESLRGKSIKAEKEGVKLQDCVFFVSDLKGATLVSGGEKIGEITEITSLKTDVFTVKCFNGKTMRFPFIKKLGPVFDAEEKTFTVDEKTLKEISCYED